jgi:hypothetical protein
VEPIWVDCPSTALIHLSQGSDELARFAGSLGSVRGRPRRGGVPIITVTPSLAHPPSSPTLLQSAPTPAHRPLQLPSSLPACLSRLVQAAELSRPTLATPSRRSGTRQGRLLIGSGNEAGPQGPDFPSASLVQLPQDSDELAPFCGSARLGELGPPAVCTLVRLSKASHSHVEDFWYV